MGLALLHKYGIGQCGQLLPNDSSLNLSEDCDQFDAMVRSIVKLYLMSRD